MIMPLSWSFTMATPLQPSISARRDERKQRGRVNVVSENLDCLMACRSRIAPKSPTNHPFCRTSTDKNNGAETFLYFSREKFSSKVKTVASGREPYL